MNAHDKMFASTMPPQEVSVDVLHEKYARDGETTVAELCARVARALAACEPEPLRLEMEQRFLWAQDHGFVPAGRINSAAGLGIKATLTNCFVQPVGDAISGHHDGLPGIYAAVAEAAETMRRGGGGYDFSAIRPAGSLVRGTRSRLRTGLLHGSVTSKVEYATQEGIKAVYLTVSFIRVEGCVGGRRVAIERPFEFFMPANQRNEGHQWITSTMRLLSLAARAGSPIAKALRDMREVVWEKGPVRCGHLAREDGVEVPVHHDSEVAAIAFMLQRMLIKRGFLDGCGNQVPVERLDRHLAARPAAHLPPGQEQAPAAAAAPRRAGRTCPECGARAPHKADGCERCAECHSIGACG